MVKRATKETKKKENAGAVKTLQPVDADGTGMSYLWATIIGFLIIALMGVGDATATKWMALFAAISVVVALLLPRCFALIKGRVTTLFLIVCGYVIWQGIATLYAYSSKLAIYEFPKPLVAFAVFLLVAAFAKPGEECFKRLSSAMATVTGIFGIISVDAASIGIISGIYKAIFARILPAYAAYGGFENGIRITGIFGNPNQYAGMMAIGTLLSIYLLFRASSSREKLLSSALLAVNALAYLLAFSMGSLFMFVLACVLMIALSGKGSRLSLFVLMLEAAVASVICAAISMAGLGKEGAMGIVALVALALSFVLLYFVDINIRERFQSGFAGNGAGSGYGKRKVVIAVVAICVLLAGYTGAALTVSSDLSLAQGETVMRSAYLPAGDYSLTLQSDETVNLFIDSQNDMELLQRTSSPLFSGNAASDITFTVPEDSDITRLYFTGTDEADSVIASAVYEGASSGDVHLGYPLLPSIIANRIQNLGANENAIQRTVFFKDGMKLFKSEPVLGRGLGGFENGVLSVQNYFYETKYAHNHYIQALCDTGVIGFLLFIGLLIASVAALIKAGRRHRALYALPVLSALVLQIFGQAITDATWSAGFVLPFIFATLAMIIVYMGDTAENTEALAPVKAAWVPSAVRIGVAVLTICFGVLLCGNLYAQVSIARGHATFDNMESYMKIDRFEKIDYLYSYVGHAAESGDDAVIEKAMEYVGELEQYHSISATPAIVGFYFDMYYDVDAFEAAAKGIEYVKSSPSAWRELFYTFEDYLDPVGPHMDDALDRLSDRKYYIETVKEFYEMLLQRNEEYLDTAYLDAYNAAFWGKMQELRLERVSDMEELFNVVAGHAFYSYYPLDVDENNIPDNLTIEAGNAEWDLDGSYKAAAGTTLSYSIYHKLQGTYLLNIMTDTPANVSVTINGKPATLTVADGRVFTLLPLANNETGELNVIKIHYDKETQVDEVSFFNMDTDPSITANEDL